MIKEFRHLIDFRIDPQLSPDARKKIELLIGEFVDVQKKFTLNSENSSYKIIIDFLSEKSVNYPRQNTDIRICVLPSNPELFFYLQSPDELDVDAICDEELTWSQLDKIIFPKLIIKLNQREKELNDIGLNNFKKLEQKIKTVIGQEQNFITDKDFLMNFIHLLIELEKKILHFNQLDKIDKIIKQFFKQNLDGLRVEILTLGTSFKNNLSENLLPLPKFKKNFLMLECNWSNISGHSILKFLFFYESLISVLSSQYEIDDSFLEEDIWDKVLDAIPFPIVLLTPVGDVCQHNSLFSKMNYPPGECLKLKLKEKVIIGEIPYNVFCKVVRHIDGEKILFVFFTESFYLRGDENITPSGQELGIISSSIAHELNNPIAGIQAAISVLQINDELSQEARDILSEMKNGALRTKQLVETFLGFSKAQPQNFGEKLHSRQIEICYQQAQNLLRFRTVESGVRFQFNFHKHADFRKNVNVSLLTMTFYLILGELMTLYSHQLLVSGKNNVDKVIRGELTESSQELQIQLSELNISNLRFSTLVKNLLNIENFVLQSNDYSLRFILNPSQENRSEI